MLITKIKINNYKCFKNTQAIELMSGINLILGKNNVGKTAFLEAVDYELKQNNFLDINSDLKMTDTFSINIEMSIPPREAMALISDTSRYNLGFHTNSSEEFALTFNRRMSTSEDLYINFFRQMSNDFFCKKDTITNFYGYDKKNEYLFAFYFEKGNSLPIRIVTGENSESFFTNLAIKACQSIYRFKAERFNTTSSPTQTDINLRSDASNLAGAIQQLAGRQPFLFDSLCKLLKQIFPDIYGIAYSNIYPPSTGKDNNWQHNVELYLWMTDPNTQREHAKIPLSECGTGVAQALAILYILVTSKESRVIVIDEPNSFLHPGAAKKLIRILKHYPQHQYIISTHSPEIISAANASNILMLTRENGETKINKIAPEDIGHALEDMGVNLSDVFGADSILWVEGKTEEECFKLITEQDEDFPIGCSIVGVINTGDFEQKKKNAPEFIFNIYTKLSKPSFLMPQAIGYIFDREKRTTQFTEDLSRKSKGLAKFLSRRMYENYLINEKALAFVINDLKVTKVSEDAIKRWILKKGFKTPYASKEYKRKSLEDKAWLNEVDGAKLLKDLFSHFSKKTLEFSKTIHGVALTKWLLENKPEVFEEIKGLIKELTNNTKLENHD